MRLKTTKLSSLGKSSIQIESIGQNSDRNFNENNCVSTSKTLEMEEVKNNQCRQMKTFNRERVKKKQTVDIDTTCTNINKGDENQVIENKDDTKEENSSLKSPAKTNDLFLADSVKNDNGDQSKFNQDLDKLNSKLIAIKCNLASKQSTEVQAWPYLLEKHRHLSIHKHTNTNCIEKSTKFSFHTFFSVAPMLSAYIQSEFKEKFLNEIFCFFPVGLLVLFAYSVKSSVLSFTFIDNLFSSFVFWKTHGDSAEDGITN